MLKQYVGSIAVLTLSLLLGGPAWAQTPSSPEPQTEDLNAPSESGGEGATVSGEDISSEELEQFVNAVVQMESIRADAREAAVIAIQGEGLTTERFSEILETQRNPESAPSTASETEMQSFQRALTQIADIQDNARNQMIQAIEAQGMQVERFDQIVEIAQNDLSLQEEIQRRLTN